MFESSILGEKYWASGVNHRLTVREITNGLLKCTIILIGSTREEGEKEIVGGDDVVSHEWWRRIWEKK